MSAPAWTRSPYPSKLPPLRTFKRTQRPTDDRDEYGRDEDEAREHRRDVREWVEELDR
jgi:hypothetical protein